MTARPTEATADLDWYQVRLTIPWTVAGAPGPQDAINISVAEVGRRIAASAARSSDIAVQDVACPSCGHEMEAALCAPNYALVVLDVVIEIAARSTEHSQQVAKRELGQRMESIPLTVIDTAPLAGEQKPDASFASLGLDAGQ